MPIHDWTRVDAGLFHAFHYHWIGNLCDALNAGALPRDYFALPGAADPWPDSRHFDFAIVNGGRGARRGRRRAGRGDGPTSNAHRAFRG